MPRVFVYEFMCGGGWRAIDPEQAPPKSLSREGRAILTAVVADFTAAPDVQVTTLRDACLDDLVLRDCEICEVRSAADEQNAIRELAAAAEWTLLIAPEFENLLLNRACWVAEAGGHLLSPTAEVIALCTDKQRTAEHLQAAGVPTPAGVTFEDWNLPPLFFPFPAVLKPRDGAGSQGVRLIQNELNLCDAAREASHQAATAGWRLEHLCPGVAASVALLCGPTGCFALPPCSQRLSSDGSFRYLGGRCPLPAELAARATDVARRAVATLPHPTGYIGVDLVLGDDSSGSDDYVIEINPRLTTSYIGLRALAHSNLAAAMLAVANGQRPGLEFFADRLEFDANGEVRKQ